MLRRNGDKKNQVEWLKKKFYFLTGYEKTGDGNHCLTKKTRKND